jgi:hypothetical protein
MITPVQQGTFSFLGTPHFNVSQSSLGQSAQGTCQAGTMSEADDIQHFFAEFAAFPLPLDFACAKLSEKFVWRSMKVLSAQLAKPSS